MKFASLAALEVVKMKTSSVESEENSSKWRHFSFGVVFIVWLFFDSANILLNRPTFQSKDYSDKDSFKAVDGIYSIETDDCTHTLNPWQAWWAVDMEQEYTITSATVTNRKTNGK